MQRYFGIADVIIVVSLFSLPFLQLSGMANDPGLGWHLVTGAFIAHTGEPPTIDPFLAWSSPRPWVANQWFSDLVFWLIYTLSGWLPLYAAVFAIYSSTFFLVVPFGLRRHGCHPLTAVVIGWIGWKLSLFHLIIRPVVLGFLFFSLCYVSVRYIVGRDKESSEIKWWPLFIWLPILFVLWANCHPSVILGLLLIGCACFVSIVEERFGPHTKRLVTLFALCLIGTVVTPYGVDIYSPTVQLGSSAYFLRLNEEWLSPDFQGLPGRLMELLVALVVTGWVMRRPGRNRLPWFDILAVVVFTHLALNSLRVLPFFAIVASVPAAEGLESLAAMLCGDRFPLLRRIGNAESRGDGGAATTKDIICFGLIWCGITSGIFGYRDPLGPSIERYPYLAIDHLTHDPRLPQDTCCIAGARFSHVGRTVLAPPEWGGFITWYGEGKLRPVLDDRNELIGEDLYRKFYAAMKPQNDWRSFSRQMGAELLMFPSNSALQYSCLKEQGCVVEYKDSVATVLRLDFDRFQLKESQGETEDGIRQE